MSTAAYHALCRDVTYHFIFVRIFSHCNITLEYNRQAPASSRLIHQKLVKQ